MSAVTAPQQATNTLLKRRLRTRIVLEKIEHTGVLLLLGLAAVLLIATPVLAVMSSAQGAAVLGNPEFLIPAISALIFLALGTATYLGRRSELNRRIFALLSITAAIGLLTTYDYLTTQTLIRIWAGAVPLAASLLFVFALIFPAEADFIAPRPLLRWAPLLLGLILTAYAQTQLGSAESIARVQAIGAGYVIGAGVLAAIFLFARGLMAASPTVREQSRVAFAGMVLTALPFLAQASGIIELPLYWLLIYLPLFPAVLAYSISQYSVLDSDRLVSFALTYSIMGAAVTLGYALVVAGLNVIAGAALDAALPATSPLLVGLLAFVLAVGFSPLRQRLTNILDSRLFRGRRNYQDRLTAFRHQLTLVSGLDEVVRLLKQQIREGLLPTHAYVFLRDSLTGNFVAAGEGNQPDTDVRFEPGSGLAHALTTVRDVLFLELSKPLPPELVEDHARFAILRTPVLAALQGQDRLAGWVAIGPKRSGEPFTIHDLRFVQALAEQASLAVERAQVIADLERRVRELDVLSQVAQAVNFTTDPDVLLELIYAQSSKLIDTTNFYIIMHNPELNALRYAFFMENDDRSEVREADYWPDAEGLAADILRTGRPIRTDDYLAECERRGIKPHGMRHRAWMGVPLNTGARTGGVMVVASYTPGVTFSEDQLKIFWAIADQAATALDKARLFNETETRARQLATLNEISKELSSTLDLENLLARIMKAAVNIIGVEAGSLLLLDEETGELVFRMVEGGEPELVGTRIPLGVGVVSEAIDTRQPVIVNNVVQDARWYNTLESGKHFQTQALLAVPLLSQDQSIGVLELINRRDGAPFDEDDAALLTTFVAQAAIAIENARLYQATDAELSRRVDELQNLQRVDRELNRTLELTRVIDTTLEWSIRLTGANAGMLGMLDETETALHVLSCNGYTDPPAELLPLDGSLAGRIIASGQPEFVNEAAFNPVGELFDEPTEQGAHIAVPILRAEQPIGVLILENDKSGQFTQQDFDFAQRLVEHAAVAIENARLVQEVQDANRSKSEFVSFVAHELKNPMTSIRGYTDLLRSGQMGEMNEMQEQFLSIIRSNVDRMTRLVSDLSDSARIEAGRLQLEMEPISVAEVIEETLASIQSQIEEKQQRLNLEMPSDLPPIYADHTRMVQVMTNLVSNAHKYTPEGGTIDVGVEIEVEPAGGGEREVIHHWVRDTGIGMSEEELAQLFTKFFRTAEAKNMAQGTGLGLNITRSLIERHGGRIWVESTVGEGSIFHYTVPVAVEPDGPPSE